MNKTAYLSSAYLGPIQYFQKLASYKECIIEQFDHYSKQTYRNRCYIAGAEGIQALTIPIVKPSTDKCIMKDIQISDHGNWQHLHWNAIVSAYNNSPYFEFYEHELYPFYEKNKYKYLRDYNEALQSLIFDFIDLEKNYTYTSLYKTEFKTFEKDFRDLIHPKKKYMDLDKECNIVPYYQVFKEKHGFLPNLSIIDLLFNKGPESIFYLNLSLIDKIK